MFIGRVAMCVTGQGLTPDWETEKDTPGEWEVLERGQRGRNLRKGSQNIGCELLGSSKC